MDEKEKGINEYKLPEEKVEDMIEDIKKLGFKVEETEEGIKISQ
jgi:5-enolpyruvylshikimate-3-phosphate synthase